MYIDNFTWHCFSVFYAKEHIVDLLHAIHDFCNNNKSYLKHWSMYFSEKQGERIDLVFISKPQHSEVLVAHIEQYFEQFLTENPSQSLEPIPYGLVVWMFYPNNSYIWNGFNIPHFLFKSKKNRDFAQATSLLMIHLYDADSSYDQNVVSMALFLSVQLRKLHHLVLPATSDPELAQTLQSYWDYEEEEEEVFLTAWKQYAHIDSGTTIIYAHLEVSEKEIMKRTSLNSV